MRNTLLFGIFSVLLLASPALALDAVDIFFNRYVLIMVFMFGISIAIAKAVGGSQVWLVFSSTLGVLTFFLAIAGLLPSWIIIATLVIASGIFAMGMLKVISGAT